MVVERKGRLMPAIALAVLKQRLIPGPRFTALHEARHEQARELFLRYSEGVVRALAGLGIDAAYRRKNDLEVRRKKIAGLGIYFHPGGGFSFTPAFWSTSTLRSCCRC